MINITILILLLTNIVNCQDTNNPLKGVGFYVNPTFQENIDRTISNLNPDEIEIEKVTQNLKIARNAPSAYWLDVMRKVQLNDTSLDSINGILLDASKNNPVAMPVFIIYDLPNRDCSAMASAGEICCNTDANGKCDFTAPGNCEQGLETYKNSYIKNIVTIINKFKNTVPMAFVIEPDSLGNLVTNAANPRCGEATQASYKTGITFTINEIHTNAPNIPIYLDLAHSGWLGYTGNAERTAQLVTSMNILDKIRGFSTNVSNYRPVGEPCPEAFFCLPSKNNTRNKCCVDPCGVNALNSSSNSELNYAQLMSTHFPGKFFIIDSSRNGAASARTYCSTWCNPRDNGLGILPTADAPLPIVDALLWLKTPGETDGCTEDLPTGEKCPRFDANCANSASLGSGPGEPRMPEAGHWSEFQMTMLARNANFGNAVPPTYSENVGITGRALRVKRSVLHIKREL